MLRGCSLADMTGDLEPRLAELRHDLGQLSRLRDPAERDRLAVRLLAELPPLLREVRTAAAHEARAGGMRLAEYARKIGISPAAVDHIYHRRATHG